MTQKALFILSTISLCCLGIYDAYLLYTYAMDVPFGDTWDLMPLVLSKWMPLLKSLLQFKNYRYLAMHDEFSNSTR